MRLAVLVLLVAALVMAPRDAQAGLGQATKDSWITSKTKMALVADKRTKARQIKVETQAGVVTLRGKVGTAVERSAAEEIARGVGGVKSVTNALQVVPLEQREAVDVRDTDVKKAVAERLDGDQQLKAATIKVRADNGLVTLMGTVPDARAKARAGELARKVPGVRAIRNELQLKS
jgi:hyperosmotically inducible protein